MKFTDTMAQQNETVNLHNYYCEQDLDSSSFQDVPVSATTGIKSKNQKF